MTIEKLTWAMIRDRVAVVNPELFSIIDKISPDDRHGLLRIRYPYGAAVLERGKLCLPTQEAETLPFDHPHFEHRYTEDYRYATTPLMLQLDKINEVFMPFSDRIVPVNLVSPGECYGVFATAGLLANIPANPIYSASAGARSVFFSTKVSDALGNRRLSQVFGAKIIQPKTLMDQHQNFKTIAYAQAAKGQAWISETLVFDRSWFSHAKDIGVWQSFYNYVLRAAWKQVQLLHFKNAFSITWEEFTNAVQSRNLKPSPYTVDTVRQLILISNQLALGFAPVHGYEDLFPAQLMEAVYRTIYLFIYAPIILAPNWLHRLSPGSGIFYSLSHPTLLEGSPALKTPGSLMSEIRDLQRLMSMIEQMLIQPKKADVGMPIRPARFEFYHSDEDQLGDIENSQFIAIS